MFELHTYVESGKGAITDAVRRAVADGMIEAANDVVDQLGQFDGIVSRRRPLFLDQSPDPGPIHAELRAATDYWRCAYCGQPRPLDKLQCVSCGAGRPEREVSKGRPPRRPLGRGVK